MHTVKVSLGFIEIAASLKFFSQAEISNENLRWLPRELFLIFWAGIFFIFGLYLLALIRLKDEEAHGIGGGRLSCALVAVLASSYFFFGALGYPLDWVTDTIAPPYHAQRLVGPDGGGAANDSERLLVEDNLESGLAQAKAAGKRALVNFTGVTCNNCRLMELKFERDPTLKRDLKKYVEIRLHTDKSGSEAVEMRSQRFQEYKVRVAASEANPIYMIVEPDLPEKPLEIFPGADLAGSRFHAFLERNVK